MAFLILLRSATAPTSIVSLVVENPEMQTGLNDKFDHLWDSEAIFLFVPISISIACLVVDIHSYCFTVTNNNYNSYMSLMLPQPF